MTKYVFVTGGVVSGLGKGITAASLGRILKARGYKVTMQKFDPYLNIDPGTLNPYEHGECYVTDDGTETDLDLGHYERFLGISTSKANNVTTGKIYNTVITKEREGAYLGKTVQIPDGFHGKIQNSSAGSAYQMVVLVGLRVVVLYAAVRTDLPDLSELRKKVQVAVHGPQADMGKILSQRAVQGIGSGVVMAQDQCLQDGFTLAAVFQFSHGASP